MSYLYLTSISFTGTYLWNSWSEEWVVLYDDSTMAWFKVRPRYQTSFACNLEEFGKITQETFNQGIKGPWIGPWIDRSRCDTKFHLNPFICHVGTCPLQWQFFFCYILIRNEEYVRDIVIFWLTLKLYYTRKSRVIVKNKNHDFVMGVMNHSTKKNYTPVAR